jgi:hypothetical protein
MSTSYPAEPWHRHDNRCYWDHTRCGWVCPPGRSDRGEITVADVLDADPRDPASPVPAPPPAPAAAI